MTWQIEFIESAEKQFAKLDTITQRRILKFLRERISGDNDPRHVGRALAGNLAGRWRYRVGDYRLICQIEDEQLLVLVLAIGHRREIYR